MKLQTYKTIILSVCESIYVFEKITGLDFDSKNDEYVRIVAEIEHLKNLTHKSKTDKKALTDSLSLSSRVFKEVDALKIRKKVDFCFGCLKYESCKKENVLTNDSGCKNFVARVFVPKVIFDDPDINKFNISEN